MKLKHTKLHWMLEAFTLIVMITSMTYLYLNWNSIPDQIPMHYNLSGNIDRYGNRDEILFLPILEICLYLLLTIVIIFPKSWNIPVQVTEMMKEPVYLNLKTMLLLMKLEIMMVFFYLLIQQIKVERVGVWFLPIFIVCLFGTLFYYIRKCKKLEKKERIF